MCCLLCLPGRVAAQEGSRPSCKPADLDVRPEFFNGPGSYFTVALNLRNVSTEACIPDFPLYFPRFSPTEAQPVKTVRFCDVCEDRLPNGQVRSRPPLLLGPGETAHQTFRWKTDSPGQALACRQLSALGGPTFLIVAPTLLKRVCSDIEASRYYLGAFPGSPGKSDGSPGDSSDAEALVLSTSSPSYYEGEEFSMHVASAFPGRGPTDEECPTLFLWMRSSDGMTRLDETHPAGFAGCKLFLFGANRDANWQTGFDLDSGEGSTWGGIGTRSFELFELISSPKDTHVQFARSNELQLQIEDPSLIPRKWRPKIKGVSVDLTLDKSTYLVGEDVPLHIATENFDAPVPVFATDPVWDPYLAIGIEVRNAQGRLLLQNERFSQGLWTGHGRAPVLYSPGKLVPIERSLKSQGWLPNHPGTYLIIVTWTTYTGPSSGEEPGLRLRSDIKPYATVQAADVLQIVDGLPPNSH